MIFFDDANLVQRYALNHVTTWAPDLAPVPGTVMVTRELSLKCSTEFHGRVTQAWKLGLMCADNVLFHLADACNPHVTYGTVCLKIEALEARLPNCTNAQGTQDEEASFVACPWPQRPPQSSPRLR